MKKRKEIIIIGPCASGKTTISIEIAKQLNINCFQIDLLRWYYFYKYGYNLTEALKIFEKNQISELNELWQPFQILTIENVLNEFANGVFDFGGTYTLLENKTDFNRVKIAFTKFSNIVLILPFKDKEKSLEIINARVKEQMFKKKLNSIQLADRFELNRRMVYNETNENLATHTFYFDEKSKEEFADEIIKSCL